MGRSRGRGRSEQICTHIIMAHIIMYARKSPPPCTEVGGAYGGVGWCACDKTNTLNHVHAHLVGFGGVCRGSVHYAVLRTVSDLWGGVNYF